ncbi:DUF3108 domain-containing protein [Pedobacter boryungensis]|uniref:DUF3108 domain-containing protein n=1 Tax=Pedobacter boryungensis TaxID=869962 RepID=A0ABX2DE41_9SPHI|nr:hypothetical protein [Pedobacter boryungensis]NQX32307.1 hypothetical protein [Pedobacter boryungensis]
MKRKLLSALLLLVLSISVNAQVDTVNAINNKLLLQNLKEGTHTYLVYMTDSLMAKRSIGDIWKRTTKFTTFHQQPVVEFKWEWLHADSTFATIINICDRKTLAPIYHYANYKGRGVFAHDFRDGFMIPTDTIKNNMATKKTKVALTIPIISWEQDLETYALLPIKKVGQKFDISFFDPNEVKPSYHTYEVVGKEDLAINSEMKVKCWLLKIKYTPDSYATFWLTEKNKEVVKMQEYFKGKYRVKVLQY